jgi:DNA primase
VMMTTTQTDFDQETLSRFVCVTVDESADMTARIHESQRQADTIEGILRRRTGDKVRDKHHNAQRLLEPLIVANPYAPRLTFPANRLNARRDNAKYLALIRAIAFLHQHQRQKQQTNHEGQVVTYIEATLHDVAAANAIAAEVLSHGGADLTPQARALLMQIRAMVGDRQGTHAPQEGTRAFTRRQAREYTGWGDWQVRAHLDELVELEYLYVHAGKMGKEYLYQLGDNVDALACHPAFGLTNVDDLRAALENPVIALRTAQTTAASTLDKNEKERKATIQRPARTYTLRALS